MTESGVTSSVFISTRLGWDAEAAAGSSNICPSAPPTSFPLTEPAGQTCPDANATSNCLP